MKIGLFYGSTTCYTEIVAEKIQGIMGADLVDIFNIKDQPLADCLDYDFIILGISTWDFGELQEDWETHWDEIDNLDLTGIQVAVYGLGDQVGYPEWFQDALGYLWAKTIAQGATAVGAWPNKGFVFTDSKALSADETMFVGLPLDDENQVELAEAYIKQWCDQIMREFGLK